MARRALGSLLLSGVLVGLGPSAWAEDLKGQVIAVADGDTVTVLDADRQRHKIRLAGIDAPESRQAYGQRSRISLKELLDGQQVLVTYDKTDRYGNDPSKAARVERSWTTPTRYSIPSLTKKENHT